MVPLNSIYKNISATFSLLQVLKELSKCLILSIQVCKRNMLQAISIDSKTTEQSKQSSNSYDSLPNRYMQQMQEREHTKLTYCQINFFLWKIHSQ